MQTAAHSLLLKDIVADFARCIRLVDSRSPQAVNARSKKPYHNGIGPHPESQTVEMVFSEMERVYPARYSGRVRTSVAYSDSSKQKCDICIGIGPAWDWAIEVKMLRMLGDNGKPNDNILMHILSPYPSHRSAVTDCEKLALSKLGTHKAILIYGYEAARFPLVDAIDAFETIAATKANLGPRLSSDFKNLIHPVHSFGTIFGWELLPSYSSA